jgi:hypothetical protein
MFAGVRFEDHPKVRETSEQPSMKKTGHARLLSENASGLATLLLRQPVICVMAWTSKYNGSSSPIGVRH